ncbi:MAG: non-canonical purine NTP pyrophosphatase [Caldilineaceae bacterium]
MPTLHYATTNTGKVHALKHAFANSQVEIVRAPLEIAEIRADDVQEIACAKARVAFAELGRPVVVMDAGFFIPSLKGFPGPYVNFALSTIGVTGLLRLVNGDDRRCEFRECLAYVDDAHAEPRCFVAHIEGELAVAPRGQMRAELWSELALIFQPPNSAATLAEMTTQQFFTWYTHAVQNYSAETRFAKWYLDGIRD